MIKGHITEIWPDCRKQTLLALGYALPYIKAYKQGAKATIPLMSPQCGVHHWPQDKNAHNMVGLCERIALPIETSSIDRALLVHDLEYCEDLNAAMDELWRVLKSSGRAIIIVPGRGGFWSGNDTTPFGHGRPFSYGQIQKLLHDHDFIHEQTREALFLPPAFYPAMLKAAPFIETAAEKCLPFMAGIHIIEVSKQLYARAKPTGGNAFVTKAIRGLVSKPANANPMDRPDQRHP